MCGAQGANGGTGGQGCRPDLLLGVPAPAGDFFDGCDDLWAVGEGQDVAVVVGGDEALTGAPVVGAGQRRLGDEIEVESEGQELAFVPAKGVPRVGGQLLTP